MPVTVRIESLSNEPTSKTITYVSDLCDSNNEVYIIERKRIDCNFGRIPLSWLIISSAPITVHKIRKLGVSMTYMNHSDLLFEGTWINPVIVFDNGRRIESNIINMVRV